MSDGPPPDQPANEDSALVRAVNLVTFLGAVALVLAQVFDIPVEPRLWALLFAVYVATNRARLRASGVTLMIAASAFGLVAALALDVAVFDVLASAGFLFGFILVIQYLGSLAKGSERVMDVARTVVSQPAGKRYLFVTFGTHGLSLLLQMGGLILVMSLLAERLRTDAQDTLQSLATGAMRGFAATSLWSPLSLSILVVFTGVSGVSYLAYLPLGLAVTFGYLMLGYWMERRRRAKPGRGGPPPAAATGNMAPIVVPVLALGAFAGVVSWALNLRMIQGVFLAALAMAIIWGIGVHVAEGRKVGDSLGTIIRTASSSVNELALVVSSIVLGTVAGIAVTVFEPFGLQLAARDAAVVAGVIPLFMLAGGFIALSPLVTATFLVGTLNAVWPEGARLWLALTLTWGWAIAACGVPFTANMMVSAQILSRSPHVLGLQWNGRFTLVTFAIASCVAVTGTYLASL